MAEHLDMSDLSINEKNLYCNIINISKEKSREIATVRRDVATLTQDSAAQANLIAEHGNRLTAQANLIAEHDNRLTAQANLIAEHDNRLTAQANLIAEHDNRLTALENRVRQLTAIINSVVTNGNPGNQSCLQDGCNAAIRIEAVVGKCEDGHPLARSWNNVTQEYINLS